MEKKQKKSMVNKLAGCLVHFAKGNFRAIPSRGLSKENQKILLKFMKRVEMATSRQELLDRLNALSIFYFSLSAFVDW